MEVNVFPPSPSRGMRNFRRTVQGVMSPNRRSKLRKTSLTNQQNKLILPENQEVIDAQINTKNDKSFEIKDEEPEVDEEMNEIEATLSKSPSRRVYM